MFFNQHSNYLSLFFKQIGVIDESCWSYTVKRQQDEIYPEVTTASITNLSKTTQEVTFE